VYFKTQGVKCTPDEHFVLHALTDNCLLKTNKKRLMTCTKGGLLYLRCTTYDIMGWAVTHVYLHVLLDTGHTDDISHSVDPQCSVEFHFEREFRFHVDFKVMQSSVRLWQSL